MIKNQQKNRFLSIGLCLVTLIPIGLTACNKESKKQPETVPTQPVKAVQQAAPLQKPMSSAAKLTPALTSQLDFNGKKDPFKPTVFEKINSVHSKKVVGSGLPIHSYDVSQFRLIGVVDNKAMVVDPNGKGYVLRVGMTIGKNEGKIISISRSGVDVLEYYRDDNGRVRKETSKIALSKKQ